MQTWYERYDEYKQMVVDRRSSFELRCKELGLDAQKVMAEVRLEVVSRAVHESNWQEGLYLDKDRTQELAVTAFEHVKVFAGPRLDMENILISHSESVMNGIRSGWSIEEVAAYNLSKAHLSLLYINIDIMIRLQAYAIRKMINYAVDDSVNKAMIEVLGEFDHRYVNEELTGKIMAAAIDLCRNSGFFSDTTPLSVPLNKTINTHGEFVEQLMFVNMDELTSLFNVDYIHFLHKIIMTGIRSQNEIGSFRQSPVHVGDPQILFPTPMAVPSLMSEFCEKLSAMILGDQVENDRKRDFILLAAKFSHSFVRIHPYIDGNGRISRLLMNFVFTNHFPPVYLKADPKGRKRYMFALRTANRGNIKPLGCLIAMSLIEIYDKVIQSLEPSKSL